MLVEIKASGWTVRQQRNQPQIYRDRKEPIMKRNQLFIPFAALVLTLAIAPAVTPAHADTGAENAKIHPVVSDHLKDFKSTVFQMRREAAKLDSFLPGNQISWESHSRALRNLTDHVNELGRTLAQMEALKDVSGESQRMAIENARPDLVVVAQNVTQAIELLNENRRTTFSPDYDDAVKNVYKHSDSLYQKMDTLLDYESARTRLDKLELEP